MPSANCFSIGKLESVENSMNAEANQAAELADDSLRSDGAARFDVAISREASC
jgi:hypothetical protein